MSRCWPAMARTPGELEEICQRFKRQWVKAVVISGGEPTIQASLPETTTFSTPWLCHQAGLNGSLPTVLEAVIDRIDYVAMTLVRPDSYEALTGFGDYEKIRQSVVSQERACDYEFGRR